MTKELVGRAVDSVKDALGELPELNSTISAIQDHSSFSEELATTPYGYIEETYIDYLKIVRDLATLSEDEVIQIAKANELCDEKGISSSAAHGGADRFLNLLGEEGRKKLLRTVWVNQGTETPNFMPALEDLSKRMQKGHDLSVSGEPTQDGDLKADKAIWGHTKGLSEKAMIHFVIGHFMERTFAAGYAQDPNSEVRKLASQKDTLLAAMGDVISLRYAQGKVDTTIFDLWESTRENNGLQWNPGKKQEIYNRVVERNYYKPFLEELGTGLNEDQMRQLIEYAKTDPEVMENTSDPTRFRNIPEIKEWMKKRTIYTMNGLDGELFGIVWFGPKPFPAEKLSDPSQLPNHHEYDITSAIRMYPPTRGLYLAGEFMSKSWEAYTETAECKRNPNKNVWLEVSAGNSNAVNAYEEFGYTRVTDEDVHGKILMVWEGK
jgi:hypothetical protein